jgi:hypothetical protein
VHRVVVRGGVEVRGSGRAYRVVGRQDKIYIRYTADPWDNDPMRPRFHVIEVSSKCLHAIYPNL